MHRSACRISAESHERGGKERGGVMHGPAQVKGSKARYRAGMEESPPLKGPTCTGTRAGGTL